MAFLIERKAALAAQLTCPAKSFDPKACYGCCDARPLICTLRQPPQTQETIELKRRKETTTMTAPPNDIDATKKFIAHLCSQGGTIDDLKTLPRFGFLILGKEVITPVDPQAYARMAALSEEDKPAYIWPYYETYCKNKGINLTTSVTKAAAPPAPPAPAAPPPPPPPGPAPQGLHRPSVVQPPPAEPPPAAAAPAETPAPEANPTGKRGRGKAASTETAAPSAEASAVIVELKESLTGIRNTVNRLLTDGADERMREFERMQGVVKHITSTEERLAALARQVELLQKDARKSQLLMGLLYETLVGTIDREVLNIQLDDLESRL